MTHLIGTENVDRFTVLDSEGNLVEGETFALAIAYGPDATTFEWTVTELGDGIYEVRHPVTAAGLYYLRLIGSTTGQVYEFSLRTDDPVVGDIVTHYFTVLDDDGVLYSGATVTVDATYDPNGEPFAVEVVDLGGGLYGASWTAASAGISTFRLLVDLSAIGDDDQRFSFETRVAETVVPESPFAAPSGTTLDDLVRGVAMVCRDFYRVRATTDATDAQTWPDRNRLAARPAKTFKGASLFVDSAASADNVGVQVHVLDSTGAALVLDPPLPAPPRAGDTAYLTNLESTGFTWDQYGEEINAQIRGIFPECVQPAVWTFTDPFDVEFPYLTPPAEFTHIYQVDYPSGAWAAESYESIPQEHEIGERDGWWWDDARDRIVLGGNYRPLLGGAYLTIRGFGRWPELVNPSDVTGVSFEWLRYAAAGVLTWSLRDQRRQAEAANNVNRADGLRIKVGTRFPPNTVRIR